MDIRSFILLCAILASANCFHNLVPAEKELIYNYKMRMMAGTETNKDIASAMYLYGKVHIQRDDHSLLVKLSDLATQTGNTHDFDEEYPKGKPLPKELSDLTKPFKINYNDTTGLVQNFLVSENEKPFVVNIKRSLAGILQMNLHVKDKRTFEEIEPTIFGMQNVRYNVMPTETNTHKVNTFTHLPKSYLFKHIYSTMDPSKCAPRVELSFVVEKTYIVKNDDNHQYIAKEITVRNELYYMPFHFKSDTQYVYGGVKMSLDSVASITKKLTVDASESKKKHLEIAPSETEPNAALGFYQDRKNVDMEKLKSQVKSMLEEAVTYMGQHHLVTTKPDFRKSQIIRRIVQSMEHFDIGAFDAMWAEYKDKKGSPIGKLYVQLLPLVGMAPSLSAIRKMIIGKQVDKETVVTLLERYAENVKDFSYKATEELEEIFIQTMQTYEEDDIKHAAILSHGATAKRVQKVRKFGNGLENLAKKSMHDDLPLHLKMVYMGALFNGGGKEVRENFDALMKEEDSIRFITMIAAEQTITGNDVFETYWPVLNNKTEMGSNRAIALYLIVKNANESFHLTSLQSYIHRETNQNQYQFFYKLLESVANSRNPCQTQKKQWAQQLLQTLDKPVDHGLMGVYQNQFYDPKYNLGGVKEVIFVSDATTLVAIFEIVKYGVGLTTQPIKIIVRIKGVTPILRNMILKTSMLKEVVLDMQDLVKSKVEAEIYVIKYGQMRKVSLIKMDSEDTVRKVISLFSASISENDLFDIMNAEVYHYIPFETGMITALELYFPKMTHGHSKVTKTHTVEEFKIAVDFDYKAWSSGRIGLKFYNSIEDKTQGVARYHSYDTETPLTFELSSKTQPVMTTQLVFLKPEDKKKAFGYKSQVTMVTYSEDLEKVTDDLELNQMSDEPDDEYYGATYFDSVNIGPDRDIIIDLLKIYMNSDKGDFFGDILHQFDLDKVQPEAEARGTIRKILPGGNQGFDKYEFTFKKAEKFPADANPLTPEITRHMNFSFVGYAKGKESFAIEFDTTLKMDSGHKNFNWEVLVSRRMGGHDRGKLCLQGHKIWSETEVNGTLTIYDAEGPLEQICDAEYKVLEISMYGNVTDQDMFESCENIKNSKLNDKYLQCFLSIDAVRSYDYTWKWHKDHKEFKSVSTTLFDAFNSFYFKYEGTHGNRPVIYGTSNEDKRLNAMFINDENQLHLWLDLGNTAFSFGNIEEKSGNFWFYQPDTPHYPTSYKLLKRIGWMRQCTFSKNKLCHRSYSKHIELSPEWTLMKGDKPVDPKYAIYAKTVEDGKMAVKFVEDDSKLIITPGKEDYTFEATGSKILYYKNVKINAKENYVAINMEKLSAFCFYDGKKMHIDMVDIDIEKHGKCHDK